MDRIFSREVGISFPALVKRREVEARSNSDSLSNTVEHIWTSSENESTILKVVSVTFAKVVGRWAVVARLDLPHRQPSFVSQQIYSREGRQRSKAEREEDYSEPALGARDVAREVPEDCADPHAHHRGDREVQEEEVWAAPDVGEGAPAEGGELGEKGGARRASGSGPELQLTQRFALLSVPRVGSLAIALHTVSCQTSSEASPFPLVVNSDDITCT